MSALSAVWDSYEARKHSWTRAKRDRKRRALNKLTRAWTRALRRVHATIAQAGEVRVVLV